MRRRRRILFAEFVARMEDTRLPICMMFGELNCWAVRAGYVGGQEKEGIRGVSWTTSELSISTTTSEWTTAAQDEGEWRKTVEQGAGRFMAKWIAAAKKAKAGLRHAVVCPNVTGRTKERIDSPKQAYSFVLVRSSYLIKLARCGANLRIQLNPPGVFWFADAMLLLFCFVFKKNLNASKPCEHPHLPGKKCLKA